MNYDDEEFSRLVKETLAAFSNNFSKAVDEFKELLAHKCIELLQDIQEREDKKDD